MPRTQEKPWQYRFSMALSLVMLALVLGYFVQSFLEIRKVQPVRVAIERIGEAGPGARAGMDVVASPATDGPEAHDGSPTRIQTD